MSAAAAPVAPHPVGFLALFYDTCGHRCHYRQHGQRCCQSALEHFAVPEPQALESSLQHTLMAAIGLQLQNPLINFQADELGEGWGQLAKGDARPVPNPRLMLSMCRHVRAEN